MKYCRKCGDELVVGENWHLSYAGNSNYLCIKCEKVYSRQYYQGRWGEYVERSRQYRKDHPEKRREYDRRYREAHRKQRRESKRQWRRDNPNKEVAQKHRRRALKLNATVGEVDEAAIYDRDKVCTYCGTDDDLTIDHLVPLARGGPHCQDNLAVACRSCNSSKGTKTYEEFMAVSNKECPECGEEMIPEGGCWTCPFCGYSKCS